LIEYSDDYVVGYCDWICDAYCWWCCYFIPFFITFLDTHCIHTQNDHELQEIIIVVSIVVGCEVSKIMMTLNERKRIRWGEGGSRILNLRACLIWQFFLYYVYILDSRNKAIRNSNQVLKNTQLKAAIEIKKRPLPQVLLSK